MTDRDPSGKTPISPGLVLTSVVLLGILICAVILAVGP
jgi:hypothetical protein